MSRELVVHDGGGGAASVALLASSELEQLGAYRGDVASVTRRHDMGTTRRTACVLVADDDGLEAGVVRLDCSACASLGVAAGDAVSLALLPDVPYAARVHVVPVTARPAQLPPQAELAARWLLPYFLDAYRPLCQGDLLLLAAAGEPPLTFSVLATDPPDSPVIVAPTTTLYCEGWLHPADVSFLATSLLDVLLPALDD